jgi:thioredoxin reductase (NADPH)
MTHNVIIIGGGPAAYAAALYTARARLNPLVLQGINPGGQLLSTTFIENWPGISSIRGYDLIKTMQEHAKLQGAQLINQQVTQIDLQTHPFTIKTKQEIWQAKTIILAMGATPRRLGVEGESTYWGKGISSCAVCDGILYAQKRVAIIGGGDSAIEAALFMAHIHADVTIIQYGDTLTASPIMQEKIKQHSNITYYYTTQVTKFMGTNDPSKGDYVTHMTLQNLKTNQELVIPIDGVFLAIGLIPATKLIKDQIACDKNGYIICPESTMTSIAGVFAAGDITDPRYRQVITASASGCKAALDTQWYLEKQ